MTRDEVLTLLERRQAAFDRQDATGYAEFYAEDATLESPLGGAVTGHDAIVKVSVAFFGAFPGATIVSEAPIVDGDRVAMAAMVSGTHTGDLLGLSPSGRPFRFPIVFLLTVRNGRIVHERRIYDFTGLLLKVGVLKAKPA